MMVAINGNERVLVCPLGWGLGHATRIIPIISYLLKKGSTVLVAGDLPSIKLLKICFPKIEYINFPSITVKLSDGKNQFFALAKIAIHLVFKTIHEQKKLKKLIAQYDIDLVISDNRYGLYSKEVKSVLITHQLSIKFPKPFRWAKPMGEWYVRRYINRFNECWIPDNPGGFRLSGELSRPKQMPKNLKFIGLLSRFSELSVADTVCKWDLVAIISGPSPHRELFEKETVELANRLSLKTIIVQGIPQNNSSTENGKVLLVPHLPDKEMAYAIHSARFIVCRSGYSTIMDLLALNRKAMLVPTPGQTEQEYLADYLNQKNIFKSCKQENIKALTIGKLEESQGLGFIQPELIFFTEI
jgi:uncharacterized protein (TIGR00661 family)